MTFKRLLWTLPVVLVVSTGSLVRAALATTTVWNQALPAVFASGVQNASPDDQFTSVSCASPGNCTAVGILKGASGGYRAFSRTSRNGVWGRAVTAAFAPGVENALPNAGFSSVSCTSAGNCTAVGWFNDSVGHQQAFTQTQRNGAWSLPVPATFAPGVQYTAPNDGFNAVSCVSSRNCTAVGALMWVPGGNDGFATISTNGVWSQGSLVTFDPGVQAPFRSSALKSVSCVSAGNCTAVGWFTDASGGFQAFSVISTNGVWGKAVPAEFAPGVQHLASNAEFAHVSCVSAGNCVAVGAFKDAGGGVQAFTSTLSGGSWATAVPVVFVPGLQNAAPDAELYSVSCVSAGNCTAAGFFVDGNGARQAFTVTSTSGSWGPVVPASFEPGVQSLTPDDEFRSVVCVSAGNCVAAGQFKDADGNKQAFTQTSSNGVWADAIPAMFTVGVQALAPTAQLTWVSCASAGNCTAVGWFTDANGHKQAFSQSTWDPSLPATGIDVWAVVLIGGALVGLGAACVIVGRRRWNGFEHTGCTVG